MSLSLVAFFGLTCATLLVRYGRNEQLPRTREGESQHHLMPVYTEMLLQICQDYPGLPDPRTLTMAEIRFFYEGVRPQLIRATKTKD